MDNKKKVIYTNYIFAVLIMINVVLLALCFILQVSVLILAVLLAEIVILSVVLMLLNKQDVYIKNFLLNHENKYLRKLYMFHSPEEGKLYEFMINNKDENRNLFLASKREAQILALQNQINPHFLYNTLESIRGEALIAGLDGVADMTEALAKFFRYTITKVENLVSVEEELDNCETYFGIQKYRFGDRLNLHIEYDPAEHEKIMNCRIPKLTLQPILENSIIHGTELKLGAGNLYIRFACTQERLIICVSDDGVGMDEETLAALNRKLGRANDSFGSSEEEKGGIALVNVNNRIHLIFGDEYGIHVYSVPDRGTDVEITIPLTESDREAKNRSVLK